MGNDRVRGLAVRSMFAAFAIILSYIEVLIPINLGVQGVKLGLANLIILLVLYNFTVKDALLINIVRVAVIGLLFGNVFSILFSMTGAVISLFFMWIAKKCRFHMIVVSVIGGITHNIGQLLIAARMVGSYYIIHYIPITFIAGFIAGLVIGLIAFILNERLKDTLKKGVRNDIIY